MFRLAHPKSRKKTKSENSFSPAVWASALRGLWVCRATQVYMPTCSKCSLFFPNSAVLWKLHCAWLYSLTFLYNLKVFQLQWQYWVVQQSFLEYHPHPRQHPILISLSVCFWDCNGFVETPKVPPLSHSTEKLYCEHPFLLYDFSTCTFHSPSSQGNCSGRMSCPCWHTQ